MSFPHFAVGWSVYLSLSGCCRLSIYGGSLRYHGSISLFLFLVMFWVGQCVSYSRYCWLAMLSHFLTVLWLGQFVALPYDAVGW